MGTHLENMLLTMYLYFAPYFSTVNIYERAENPLDLATSLGSHLFWKENSMFLSCL